VYGTMWTEADKGEGGSIFSEFSRRPLWMAHNVYGVRIVITPAATVRLHYHVTVLGKCFAYSGHCDEAVQFAASWCSARNRMLSVTWCICHRQL